MVLELTEDERALLEDELNRRVMSRENRQRLDERFLDREKSAQDFGLDQQLYAGLGRAAEKIGSALSQTEADTGFYDQMASGAMEPLSRVQRMTDERLARRRELANYLQKKRDQGQALQDQREHDRALLESKREYQKKLLDDERAYKDQVLRDKQAHDMLMQDRKAAQAMTLSQAKEASKKKKLSPTEMKKQGLFEIGRKAEKQYQQALASKDFDPTSYREFLDNTSWVPNALKDNAAIQAKAAADSWIDSFLRDESGAAIPEDERSAYYKIYFPQPGDDKTTVANKQRLRNQKMANAAISAGFEPETVMAELEKDSGWVPSEGGLITETALAGSDVKANLKPGDIVTLKDGKSYRVDENGDLEEITQGAR